MRRAPTLFFFTSFDIRVVMNQFTFGFRQHRRRFRQSREVQRDYRQSGIRASPTWVMPPRTTPRAAMPRLNRKTLQSTIKAHVRSWPKKAEILPKPSMKAVQAVSRTASLLF